MNRIELRANAMPRRSSVGKPDVDLARRLQPPALKRRTGHGATRHFRNSSRSLEKSTLNTGELATSRFVRHYEAMSHLTTAKLAAAAIR